MAKFICSLYLGRCNLFNLTRCRNKIFDYQNSYKHTQTKSYVSSVGSLPGVGHVEGSDSNLGKIVDLTLKETGVKKESYQVKESDKERESEDKELNYTKLNKHEKLLSQFLINVKSSKKRKKSGLILLEGRRLIQDALDAQLLPVALFFSRLADAKELNVPESCKMYQTSYKSLQLWSDVETCQGVMGIFPMPDVSNYDTTGSAPLTVICDNVRDPGNVGSILRTVTAVGCKQVIFTKGCADVWDSKVLRSAAGTHFRMKMHVSVPWEDIPQILDAETKVFLADSEPPQSMEIEDAPPVDIYELTDTGEKRIIQNDPRRTTPFQKRSKANSLLPLLPYLDVDFGINDPLALVIGGETEGLSEAALRLAEGTGGSRVYIPLKNKVESLNCGTALGVIAYEILRQKFHGKIE